MNNDNNNNNDENVNLFNNGNIGLRFIRQRHNGCGGGWGGYYSGGYGLWLARSGGVWRLGSCRHKNTSFVLYTNKIKNGAATL